ncbi:MAG: glycosyltransferase family 2 protein [Hyphomonadaceae bacterium]|nr:glycosyltransferase family 2 protein [Hyphomonadaceae bacterium]
MTEIIITMAGFGRRFLDAGYTVPKYRIEAHGAPLFFWSIVSLRQFIEAGAHFTFVVRGADEAAAFIRAEAKKLGIVHSAIIELDAPTDGQATTAILAREHIVDRGAPMLIYNIDTFTHPDVLNPRDVRGAGWIPCFDAPGEGWSFAAADAEGRVSEVREKVRISNHATIGLYWFDSFARYEDVYARHYADPANLEKGERYVAPIYNRLIADGGHVYVHDIPFSAAIPLGTPAEVERFIAGSPPQI